MRLRTTIAITYDGSGLDAALESAADAVLITVADNRRGAADARTEAQSAISRIAASGKAALALVNHPRTRMLRDDLDALVSPALGAVLLPHTVEPQDVRDLAVLLREFEHTRGIEPGTIGAFPVIDTARGLLRVAEIADASPRVRGLVFDSAAYSRDVGARDEEMGPRLAYARGAVVASARATDGIPLIATSSIESVQTSHYGFAGIILPDVQGLIGAASTFTPSAAEIVLAQRQVAAYAAARAEGAWVARVDAGVVDAHGARHAHRILEQAGIEPTPTAADEPPIPEGEA